MKHRVIPSILVPVSIVLVSMGSMGSARAADPIATGSEPKPLTAQPTTTSSAPVTTAPTSGLGSLVESVSSAASSVSDFFSNLSQLGSTLTSSLGQLQIPDITQVIGQIMDGNFSGDGLEKALNGQLGGGTAFSVRKNAADQAERDLSTSNAIAKTLSGQAQTQLQQQNGLADQAVQQSQKLATESQNSDVTQHIMQNMSQQMANAAAIDRQILEEARQARIDRATDAVVQAQIAEGIASANIADRRESAATNNEVIKTTGMMLLPGGRTFVQAK